MAEMNNDHMQSQIYMRKLLESHKENEALCTQNNALSTRNSTLIQQNEDLSAQNSGLQLQNKEMEKQINSLQNNNEQLRDKLTTAEAWGQFQTKKVKARAKAVAVALLLTVALLIGETAYERRQRINKESDLEKVQDALCEAEGELDKFYSEFAEMCEALFGSSSEDFYAEEAFIVLHIGETKNVKIYKNFLTWMTITESDEEAITAQKIIENCRISDVEIDVEITAHSPGYYTVEFAEGALNITGSLESGNMDVEFETVEAFDLLVIVLDE